MAEKCVAFLHRCKHFKLQCVLFKWKGLKKNVVSPINPFYNNSIVGYIYLFFCFFLMLAAHRCLTTVDCLLLLLNNCCWVYKAFSLAHMTHKRPCIVVINVKHGKVKRPTAKNLTDVARSRYIDKINLTKLFITFTDLVLHLYIKVLIKVSYFFLAQRRRLTCTFVHVSIF